MAVTVLVSSVGTLLLERRVRHASRPSDSYYRSAHLKAKINSQLFVVAI